MECDVDEEDVIRECDEEDHNVEYDTDPEEDDEVDEASAALESLGFGAEDAAADCDFAIEAKLGYATSAEDALN